MGMMVIWLKLPAATVSAKCACFLMSRMSENLCNASPESCLKMDNSHPHGCLYRFLREQVAQCGSLIVRIKGFRFLILNRPGAYSAYLDTNHRDPQMPHLEGNGNAMTFGNSSMELLSNLKEINSGLFSSILERVCTIRCTSRVATKKDCKNHLIMLWPARRCATKRLWRSKQHLMIECKQ
jgi:hypothetical protein